jgi:predicted ArsR family transcriptional regulator
MAQEKFHVDKYTNIKISTSSHLSKRRQKMYYNVKPKRHEVRGELRKLHNEELSDLYSSPNFIGLSIKKNDMGRACNMYRGEDKCIQGFDGEN